MPKPEITYSQLLETNNLIQQNSDETYWLCATRTVQESKIFPVSAYILFSYLNCFYRYPELLKKIEANMSAEEVGDRARSSGVKILAWTIPCFYLLGREMLINWGVIKPTDAVEDVVYVMDFWKRFQLSWHRNNGGLTNKQGGHRAQIFPEQKLQVFHADAFECAIGDSLHTAAQEFMATVAQYGFLVSCESRLTIHNHGPYKISDNREMLIRDFRELSEYDFPWLDNVANELDYNNLTVAMIVEDTHITLLDDWGSFEAEPELKSEHIKAIGLWTADNLTNGHIPVGMDSPEELAATFRGLTIKVKEATSKLWTQMAGWSRDQQMDAGALNYFAVAKELAHIAGCYEMEDWMMIDNRAERFRPLLNDEYGNLFLGELVGMITQPSQMAHGYTMAQHTDRPTKGLSFIPYSILKEEPYTFGVGPIRGGITNLSTKVDRYRTSKGLMTQKQLNDECLSFKMTCCEEKYRLLCADWVKYHFDTDLADELFKIEQMHSRNLKDCGAGLTCQDIESMRLARAEKT
jgi:hypothetical protein